VPAIVETAGTSIGGFYARFPSRMAMIHVLDERFFADAQSLVDELLDDHCLATEPWPVVFGHLAEATIDLFRRHRGFMKAAFYHTRMQPDPNCVERARIGNQRVLGRVTASLLPRIGQLGHPDPELGLALALEWMTGSVRDTVVFGELNTSVQQASDPVYVGELVRMMSAYLDAPGDS
jgi:AcrR family transcriptional regulator